MISAGCCIPCHSLALLLVIILSSFAFNARWCNDAMPADRRGPGSCTPTRSTLVDGARCASQIISGGVVFVFAAVEIGGHPVHDRTRREHSIHRCRRRRGCRLLLLCLIGLRRFSLCWGGRRKKA
jgi:hypothetical protein